MADLVAAASPGGPNRLLRWQAGRKLRLRRKVLCCGGRRRQRVAVGEPSRPLALQVGCQGQVRDTSSPLCVSPTEDEHHNLCLATEDDLHAHRKIKAAAVGNERTYGLTASGSVISWPNSDPSSVKSESVPGGWFSSSKVRTPMHSTPHPPSHRFNAPKLCFPQDAWAGQLLGMIRTFLHSFHWDHQYNCSEGLCRHAPAPQTLRIVSNLQRC